MKLSIAIPTHNMKNKEFFLNRLLKSLEIQTFRDFEIVITENGKGMASNTNEAIRKSKGELIKILYMDDYLSHKDSLQRIVDFFKGNWLVTGCEHDDGDGNRFVDHFPSFNKEMSENFIGSPSVLTIKNGLDIYFDETMTWLLDLDFYKRLYKQYGEPTILNEINVVIGVGDHQTTNLLTEDQKLQEVDYIKQKHGI